MGDIKNILTVVVLLLVIIGNVYAFIKWNSKFITKDDCVACKKESKVADEETRNDIKNIKTAIVEEERHIKTLGIVQVLMCRHIGMKKEEIDMFKDAIENGTDVSSLL